MKKVILKVHVPDAKAKRKTMKTISTFSGIESISVDMKEQKLTIIGDIDPVKVAGKLRKLGYAEIVSVGPKDGKKDAANKLLYPHPYDYYYPTYYKVVPSDDSSNSCAIL